MLLELEAEHEQIVVDLMSGEGNTPQFHAINPMGKMPALVAVMLLLQRSPQFALISRTRLEAMPGDH